MWPLPWSEIWKLWMGWIIILRFSLISGCIFLIYNFRFFPWHYLRPKVPCLFPPWELTLTRTNGKILIVDQALPSICHEGPKHLQFNSQIPIKLAPWKAMCCISTFLHLGLNPVFGAKKINLAIPNTARWTMVWVVKPPQNLVLFYTSLGNHHSNESIYWSRVHQGCKRTFKLLPEKLLSLLIAQSSKVCTPKQVLTYGWPEIW